MLLGESVRPAATADPARRRGSRRRWWFFLALIVATVLAVILAVSLGPVRVPFDQTGLALLRQIGLPVHENGRYALVVSQIRLPRVLVGLLVGMALSVAGVIMQALFRNPLADPGVTGVSSGAAVAAVALLATGAAATGSWVLPVGAFGGALAALLLIHLVAALRRDGSSATLLLVGIALNALLGAVISSVITNLPDNQTLRSVVFWLNGDLVGRSWSDVDLVVLPVLLGLAAAAAFVRDLNVLLLGEAAAQAAGVDVVRVRRMLLAIAALLTGASVAVTGVIGFVGLVVPHMVRLLIGPDHRALLPASALFGGAFLVLADLCARLLFSPFTLQTGTVTALIGAPSFLVLVLRRRARVAR